MATGDGAANAVVVPFGVPNAGRGLGLGLAALVHGFARIRGEHVGLAQIVGRRAGEPDGPAEPVEAFVPPQAWREMAGQGNAPADVRLVMTGAFEPPDEVAGTLRLLVFDAKDGAHKSVIEVHVDAERAGAAIVDAVEHVWSGHGDLGDWRALRELTWPALESVLRAERCALHDPARGGPHDRLAAMMHLGRAVEEAPDARYPAGRLAAIALDAALGTRSDPKLAEAAVRAVTRAIADAPGQPDLLEATAALQVRLGQSIEGEATALAGLARDPARVRLYALLSEARRRRGDLEGAKRAIDEGVARGPHDTALLVELGVVRAEIGDTVGAEQAWREVLGREPLNPPAFTHLAAFVMRRGDTTGAQSLVDVALAGRGAHVEVLRCALRMAHAAEPEGVARDARIATLARSLLTREPEDAGAALALAHALARTGETKEAARAFTKVEALAVHTPLAAEAQRARFALGEPMAAQEIEAVLRAVNSPSPAAGLDALSMRARRLAAEHPVWPAWVALGIIERRRGALAPAREALSAALAACDGCSDAHRELARVDARAMDERGAMRHAERAIALEGSTPAALGAMAEALACAGRRAEAQATIAQALSATPEDAELLEIAAAVHGSDAPPSAMTRLRESIAKLRKVR